MKCSNHPEAEALDLCPVCHKPICTGCAVGLAGKNFCRDCLEKRVSRYGVRTHVKSRFLAFLFSLVPGGGYFYLGLMKRGLQTMVIFFGTFFLAVTTNLEALVAFVAPILIFYSVFDTQQLLNQITEGQLVEDRELFDWGSWDSKRGLIGAALIVLGSLALLDNLAPYFIDMYTLRRFTAPLLIIGAGVYILYRNTRPKGGITDGNNQQDH